MTSTRRSSSFAPASPSLLRRRFCISRWRVPIEKLDASRKPSASAWSFSGSIVHAATTKPSNPAHFSCHWGLSPLSRRWGTVPTGGVLARLTSGEQFLHYFAADVRQPEVAALELVRQFLVIDAHQIQHRRVQVVHVHRIF